MGVSLVALLGTGLSVSRGALDAAETTLLAENVQTRLTLDPQWPGGRDELFFDNGGAEVKEEQAVFRVTFKKVAGPGFSSAYFDTFRVALERLPARESAGVWMLQRARLANGAPLAATKP